MKDRTITSIIDKEHKNFSRYVCYHRAIPNLIDGFKPAQRKAFYVLLKSNSEIKVMAIAGKMISNCLHGETEIILSNGKKISIQDFYEHYKNEILYVKSFDIENNKDVVGSAFNPIIKKYTDKLIEIELDSGDIFKCTEDHLILTIDGYKKAKKITENDEIIKL